MLVQANGLAAAAILLVEATSQISTRHITPIMILCWTVLTLLLGPPATLAFLFKKITWEAWQVCALLVLHIHVVVAIGEELVVVMVKVRSLPACS